jgi:hypothetical protein
VSEEFDQKVIVGGTGDGRIKTQVMETPAGQPDVVVSLVPTALAVLVRAFDTFLTIIVSLISAGMTTNVIPATDFVDLAGKCASLSIAGAGLGMLKDLIVIAGKLKRRYPLLDV